MCCNGYWRSSRQPVCLRITLEIVTMIRLATVFSGIGSVEQALLRLGIEHEIVFACDNGDVELKLLPRAEQQEFEALVKKEKADELSDAEAMRLSELREIVEAREAKIRGILGRLDDKDDKRHFVERIYAMHSRQTNNVRTTYFANYNIDPKDFHLDIRYLDGRDYAGRVDLLVGGSPCQSFSTVGAQRGLEDARGTLFYDFARIVSEVRPKVFIYENVKGLTTNDEGRTLETIKRIFTDTLHYRISDEQVLNAANYGIPQTRRRLFIIGIRDDVQSREFKYPEPVELRYTMQDFLEEQCAQGHFGYDDTTGELVVERVAGHPDPKFILTPGVQKYVLASGTKNFRTSTKTDLPIARTLLKTMTQHHRAGVDNYITVSEEPKVLRALTDRECLRLMGYPDSFKIVVSSPQVYRQAGNSIVVDVMMAIIREIILTGALD